MKTKKSFLMTALALCIAALLVQSPAKADVVVHDTLGNVQTDIIPVFHSQTSGGTVDDGVVLPRFYANWQGERQLSRFGFYYVTSSGDGVPNGGDPTGWNWRFHNWDGGVSHFLADPFGNGLAWGTDRIEIDAPSNPDYLDPLFQVSGGGFSWNVYYADFDLNSLQHHA